MNLECRSETCCAQLAENTARKKLPKSRHLATILRLCRAISSQLSHVSTVGKNVKHQYLPHMSSQYGELRPTNGWDRSGSLGHPCKFQRVSHLGSVTARHSSSGRQPNFAALNRGRHRYSAGRPSRWALAHISSCSIICRRSPASGGLRPLNHPEGPCPGPHWGLSSPDPVSKPLSKSWTRYLSLLSKGLFC